MRIISTLALFIGAASVAAQPANFEIRPGLTGATSTRQASEITYASACGAKGIGRDTAGRIIEYQEAGRYVDVLGRWMPCEMPATTRAPAPPQDAPGRCTMPGLVEWAGPEWYMRCTAPAGTATMEHGDSRVYQTPRNGGPFEGLQQLTCRNGVLVSGPSVCRRTTECDVSLGWTGSDDGGRTRWQWAGVLAEGATAQAAAPDGRTRPITCSFGVIRWG